jgi:hypothetical protein
MKIKGILSLGLGLCAIASGIASSINPAAAIPYSSNTVYKTLDATNGTTIYISGTANSKSLVSLGTVDRSTARIAGACGELKISIPSSGSFTGLKVDSMAIDASALSTQILPSCVSGTFAETRSANFKTPNGQVVIVGKIPGAAIAITLPTDATKNVSINGCGFGFFRASSGSTLPTSFDIGTTTYTVASLPDAGEPPVCKTSNGVSTGYVPSSWP